MTVEFISAINTRPGDELNPQRGGAPFDPAYLRRYARTLDDAGFDYTLVPYGSTSADSFVVATAVAAATERIKPIVAVRPNTVFPTVAAQQLATLDQVSQGRAVVRIISGGSDAEQARQGDFLSKDERYDRSEEWIRIVRRAWTEREPFSHEGRYYRFEDFGPGFPTFGDIPISVGGSSDAAYRVGGELGDIFGLWGEPLADTREQIARVNAEAGTSCGRRAPWPPASSRPWTGRCLLCGPFRGASRRTCRRGERCDEPTERAAAGERRRAQIARIVAGGGDDPGAVSPRCASGRWISPCRRSIRASSSAAESAASLSSASSPSGTSPEYL